MSEPLTLIKTTSLGKIARILWYPSYLDGTPALCVLWMPPILHATDIQGLNRKFRVVFVETDDDRRTVEQALTQPLHVGENNTIDMREGIDQVNWRPSTLPRLDHAAAVILYCPSETGWPYFVVVMGFQNDSGQDFARDRYAWDALQPNCKPCNTWRSLLLTADSWRKEPNTRFEFRHFKEDR